MTSYKRAQEIERNLNQIRVCKDVGVGELLGVYMSISLAERQPFIKLLLRNLYHFFIQKRKHLCVYKVVQKKSILGRPRILVGLATLSPRLLSFFDSILNSTDDVHIYSRDKYEESKYMLHKKHIIYKTSILNVGMQILRIKKLSIYEKFLILDGLSMQLSALYAWRHVLCKENYQCVIVDLDRYPSNATLILAARSIGIPTISLVHGAINPIYNYIPVLASNLFVWGRFHIRQFEKHNSTNCRLHVVGNPKIKAVEKSMNSSLTTIGLGTTKLPESERSKLLNIFLDGTKGSFRRVIKIHPLESFEAYESLSRKHKHVEVFNVNGATDEFLGTIDLLCVRRSQLGSDALAYHIPIVIIDGINPEDLQNGELLNRYAGCPIVNSATELAMEINRLKTDRKYWQSRLEKQQSYFFELYEFIDKEAESKLLEKLTLVKG